MITLKSDPTDLFQVFTVLGLGSILTDATDSPCYVSWDEDGLAHIDCTDVSLSEAAQAVKDHAERSFKSDWMTARISVNGKMRGTLSPRIGRFNDSERYRGVQQARWSAIDELSPWSTADWRLIGALGEPAYWWVGKEATNPDFGASMWEMKTRNRGEEFIQNRLSLLAESVSLRDWPAIESGLAGTSLVDEAGKNADDSRTPTGLRRPGPADNAAAWCALVGLGMTSTRPVSPSAIQPTPRSKTAGAARTRSSSGSSQWLYAPIPTRPVSLSRIRAVFRSQALEDFALSAIHSQDPDGRRESGGDVARQWLNDHGIGAVTIARKQFTDNPNAPEPWAVPTVFETTESSE